MNEVANRYEVTYTTTYNAKLELQKETVRVIAKSKREAKTLASKQIPWGSKITNAKCLGKVR